VRLVPLTDEACRNAVLALITAVPTVGFIALQAAKLWGSAFAWSFVGLMAVLLGLIGVQAVRSRRANSLARKCDR